ncbi:MULTISPECIES: adenosylcobinamide-phosphate synthase CbiB [Thermoactinomyces]|jgi:adenosylcobinamide-phosphate synthase|uniref:Cobalamin biosynthesis protein CobD n=1 Tax=Thermoactinomyces daqus TaxID=1329516 RepID=A0A7W1XBM4_9BACL|nr:MULTISPECIES: adenosylcobinamide-phosphate synthase CbiB [Thermoactinomyces]MBA4543650.1 cobalamin biosynthesis protein CobD [Thermoactinomyces daqus]MBH8597101.1 cobalamin biosynthesis protein CobD [Thermoactinomyces sp. CICC 10523]MBH8602661.1 cobalamin biosynthesis protein CobD [Thermoactinomyces sp. CICC 10522]MBH8606228.1 cobalamin biosynthesis protein CobD [Thermoactinomyces sp. CICC 10521]
MEKIWIICGAFLLELMFGDPRWLPHPVAGIGRCITWLEKGLLRLISRLAVTGRKVRLLGLLFPLVIAGGTYGLAWGITKLCDGWSPLAGLVSEIVLVWLTIAPKGLADAGNQIFRALAEGDVEKARRELAMVVGRDTEHLDCDEIVRGGVETVAENIVDAVISPLFYALIGGAPLAFAYRAVNTLDAMVGYRNEKYIDLGWASARLDDLANWLPARLTVIPMLAAAFCLRLDFRSGWRVVRRDAHLHPSPNSGIPESLMAGALNIQLGGTNTYQGKVSVRARLGDPRQPKKRVHLKLAVRMMWWTTVLFIAGCCEIVLVWKKMFFQSCMIPPF